MKELMRDLVCTLEIAYNAQKCRKGQVLAVHPKTMLRVVAAALAGFNTALTADEIEEAHNFAASNIASQEGLHEAVQSGQVH